MQKLTYSCRRIVIACAHSTSYMYAWAYAHQLKTPILVRNQTAGIILWMLQPMRDDIVYHQVTIKNDNSTPVIHFANIFAIAIEI